MHRYLLLGLLLLSLLAGCRKEDPSIRFEDLNLEAANPQHGESLFSQTLEDAPACSTCHRLDGNQSAGPALNGYAERAATRVEGQSAAEYSYESILRPSRHVVSGFSNVMYAKYEAVLNASDLADLIAYLLTL